MARAIYLGFSDSKLQNVGFLHRYRCEKIARALFGNLPPPNPFDYCVRRNPLPTDWPHNDREQVNRAREAAEALFKPRQQVARAEASVAAPRTPSLSEQT